MRFFKQKHETPRVEIELEHIAEQRQVPKVDILLAFYLNYYSPRYGDTDRKMGISEKVMQSMG